MFVDASVIVAILIGEPGHEELLKVLDSTTKLYVSPMVKFEATAALSRVLAGENNPRTPEVFQEARAAVQDFMDTLRANEIAVDARVGNLALDAMATYGKLAGHPASLNMGDCFAYAAAKSYRLKLAYKGNDFALTDLA